jgi:hypothetical protein
MVASITKRPSAEKTARAARKRWRQYQADRQVFAAAGICGRKHIDGAAPNALGSRNIDRYRRTPMGKLGDGDRH